MNVEEILKQKAKTPLEIERYVKEWRATFRKGAMGDHRAYAEARDTRHFIDEERWISEKDVLKILEGKMVVSKQKLRELADLLKTYSREIKVTDCWNNEKLALKLKECGEFFKVFEKKFAEFGVESAKKETTK